MTPNDTARTPGSAARLALLKQRLARGAETASGIPRRTGEPRLSFAQERMWFLNEMEPESPVYGIPLALRLRGALDRGALERSLTEVVRRHEVLRTTFRAAEAGPEPVIHPAAPLALPVEAVDEAQVAERVRGEAARPFALAGEPPFRATLLRVAEDEHVLLLCMHHIAADGWSLGVFAQELTALYTAYTRGEASPLPEPEIQYADYAAWQREQLRGERLERELEYWKERLQGAPALLELPTDRPRPAVRTHRGATHRFTLDAPLVAELRALAQREGSSLYMVLLAAWGVLLSRYAGQDDVVVGSPIAGRPRRELEGLIGLFINTLALRVDLAGAPTFRELLKRVRDTTLSAYQHQDLPFEKVVEALAPDRSLSHSPLFQAMLIVPNVPRSSLSLPGLELSRIPSDGEVARYDLTLFVNDGQDVAPAQIEYSTELFDAATIERMAEHLRVLLEGVAADPARPISRLPLMSLAERDRILADGMNTEAELPTACIHELFEAWAERTPEAAAVHFGDTTLSFAEVEEAANRLAHHLRARGVGPEARVAVHMERTPDLVVALMAVLKAGGAYVPLDPAYPRERLRFMLRDCGARVLLTHERLLAGFDGAGADVVCVDRDRAAIARELASPPETGVAPRNLAYLIYTSGSTGRPKGVAVEHRNTAAFLSWFERTVSPEERACLLASTSVSFDVSASEIFGALCTGGAMVLVENALAPVTHPIQMASMVPSAAAELLRTGRVPATLRSVHLAGEPIPAPVVKGLYACPGVERVWNLYGPSEDTTYSTLARLPRDGERNPPIGRAIDGSSAYVLDAHLAPVPVGVPGELYLAGAGITRGYLGRPALTAEKFVPDPFAPGRMYRTGDRVRWLPSGEMEYLGRIDFQVKVRGFRIELGEIESALCAHPGIAEAVAVVREDEPGDRRLVAYVGGAAEPAALKALLRERLPEYMVPSAIVVLDRLPLSPNGKTDRAALPAPWGIVEEDAGYVAPRTPLEEVLCGICADVLRAGRVGIHDSFFELGGHSLLATRVVSRVRAVLGAELPLRALFEAPTVAELAARVSLDAGTQSPPLKRAPRGAPLPLSFAQQRLWFLDRLEPGRASYNMPFALRVRGPLDVDALESALAELVRRHEPLRTVFREVDGEPAQVILDTLASELAATTAQSPPARTGLPAPAEAVQSPQGDFVQLLPRLQSPGMPLLQTPGTPDLRTPGKLHLQTQDKPDLQSLSTPDLRTSGTRDLHSPSKPHLQSPGTPSTLVRVNLDSLDSADRERELAELAAAEAARPFDLERGPLLRSTLVRLGEDEHALLFTLHHIVSDGWSMGVFGRELSALYAAFARGEEPTLPELPIQYADHAAWQRQWLAADALEREAGYWRERLAGAPPRLELPTDSPRPAVADGVGARVSFTLPAETLQALRTLSRREGATLFMALCAAWQLLLARYAGESDVSVGTPIAGRTRAETEGLIGFFINTLVLRTDLSGEPTFSELLGRVRETALGAYAHQDLPFEKLVEEVGAERIPGTTPLFQAMLVLQNTAPAGLVLEGARVEKLEVSGEPAKFDLLLSLREAEDGLAASLTYRTELWREESVARMAEHFRRLVESAVADPDRRITELEMLSPGERERVLGEWSTRGAAVPDGCVHERFAEQARLTPQAVALSWEGGELSYAELDARANRLAHALRRRGVGPEVRVGVALERSPDAIVAHLAVLKAGGAYVPVDPDHPRERLAYLLGDAAVSVTVTRAALADRLPAGQVLCVDDPSLTHEPEHAPETVTSPENLAYVMYTSGSTGTPKGAAIPHRAIVRLVRDTDFMRLGADEVFLQLAPLSFDAATLELWGPLLNGGRLALAPAGSPSIQQIGEVIARERVTSLWLTASLFHLVVDEHPEALAGVRQLLAGGEALSPEHVRRALEAHPGMRLINGYGPTENTTFTCCHTIPLEDAARGAIPIGRPVAHTRVYVLDAALRPVPVGVPGELYAAGAGLARGYLDRPAQTADKFVPDPFRPGERMYRTGDRARWRADGVVEFLGRVDTQVKIRGFRIEPGEIEAALEAHPDVREAVVLVREDVPGERRLVAYVVGAPAGLDLRAYLAERLPPFMLPSAVVMLDALPLTANGKTDRRALPAPELAADAYVAPRTPVEEVLAGIWEEVLRVERVGADDDFFQLGGHSLLATRVISRVRTALSVEVPLRALFEAPTVAGLAARVEAELRAGSAPPAPPVTRVERNGPLPLSFAQQRLWFIHQMDPESTAYHITSVLRLRGELGVEALERALGEIVRRHEILRTTFHEAGGAPVQVIHPAAPLRLAAEPTDEAGLEARLRAEAARPFELAAGPLFRAKLLRLDEDEHVLLLAMHHIVSDGWSLGVFARELSALYAAYLRGEQSALAEPEVQYADYAVWQREQLGGERLESELAYWKERLQGAPALLELPTDRPRPAVQRHRGAIERIEIDAELGRGLKALAQREGATLYMVMMAAFQVLLARYSGQDDVVVGTTLAGRTRAELEGTIGMFFNTLALRGDLAGNPTFRALLGRVRETMLGAHQHQELPFERLVEALAPARTLSYTPLFQVLFELHSGSGAGLSLPGLEVSPVRLATDAAKLDLSLALTERSGALSGGMQYDTDLFDPATIRRMLAHYQVLLRQIVAEPARTLQDLSLLTPEERNRVVAEWNATEAPSPITCIHRMFEEQADLTPDAVAVVYESETLTYAELDGRANQLANALRTRGVGREVRVALCVERSPEMVIGLLGILKAGAAYVPLDPTYPSDRVAYQLQDSGAVLLLTQERLLGTLSPHDVPVLCLDRDRAEIDREPAARPETGSTPHDLAYVYYTSGSTGRPKGVLMPHLGVCNYIAWARDAYGAAAGQGAPVFSSIAVDLTLTNFLPLFVGRRVVLVPEGPGIDALAAILRRERDFSFIKITPTHLMLLNQVLTPEEAAASARTLVIGADDLPADSTVFWQQAAPGTVLLNEYGPTETVVGCSIFTIPPGTRGTGSVPIGRPISNITMYVLDAHMEPVPVGVPGELYIGGIGVARGYHGRPALTAEKFVPDPFSGVPGARFYRTGDRARFLDTGDIQFLGRVDHQIKIRGFRVELGEIEAVLRDQPLVDDAVVTVREDRPGDRRLVAYVVTAAPRLATADLRRALRERLPDYMVPGAFVALKELPVGSSGKLDRKHLPPPDEEREVGDTYTAPADAVERQLVEIWEEVIGVRPIGATDGFFDVGGNSLLAIRLLPRVRAELGYDLPLATLVTGGTIREIAAVIREARGVEIAPASPLVAIQPHGARPPLFCVHSAGGGVMGYLSLARHLGPDQPLYGLQDPLHARGGHSHIPIEELASVYVDAVRAHQPHGPYHLLGWSFGGVVAYEMAQQLARAGEEVALLGLLDTVNTAAGYAEFFADPDAVNSRILFSLAREAAARQGRELDLAFTDVRAMAGDALVDSVLRRLKDAGVVAETVQRDDVKRSLERWWAREGFLSRYVPAPYPGRLTLFRATEIDADMRESWPALVDHIVADPLRGWGTLCDVEALDTPGQHATLGSEPHVRRLAELVRASLARAQGREEKEEMRMVAV